jgi:hypothetical protein
MSYHSVTIKAFQRDKKINSYSFVGCVAMGD